MVDEIKGVGQVGAGHAEPNKGVKLSELQKVNAKLYEYFKAQNLKDDSYVTLSDLDRLISYTDKNQNGKMSVKEAKKFGFEGSRKEIKSMISSMDTVREKINNSDNYITENKDGTKDFYEGDNRVKSEYKGKNYEYTILYGKDGKTPKESYMEELVNGEKVKTKTVYHQGSKNYDEIETDKEKIFKLYNPSNDQHLTRIVKELKSDSNSKETIEYTHGAGLSYTAKHTYTGEYVKDGITEDTVTFDENGKEVSHKTNFDLKEEAVKNAEQEKAVQFAKEEPQEAVREANPQKFKVPEGWSVSDIAKAFGISREEVLRANTNADGEKAFRTNKKGVEYFLIDQEINLPEGAEFNKEYKPKPRVKSQGHSGGLSEADRLAAQEAIDSANKAIGASKRAKINPRVGLGKGKPLPKPAAPVAPQPETAPKDEVKPAQPAKETAPAQPVDDEVAPSTSPQIPRDMNPPKTDATGMNYTTGFYATGPKDGTMNDIYGNVYHYDEEGRLEQIVDKDGYTRYEYHYNDQNEVTRYTDYTGNGWIDRNSKGKVITYQNSDNYIRYGNGVALNDQDDYSAKMKDWHLPKNFGPKGLKKK